MKTHILFDFDGTLVDSAPAILSCFALVLKNHGLQAHCAIDDSLIGPPLRQTLETLSGQSSPQLLDALSASFKDIYDAVACLSTPAYAGCQAILEALREQGLVLGIATNKRLLPTQKIIAALGWQGLFAKVFASDCHPGLYSDKTGMIDALLREFEIAPQAAIYVGDTEHDGRAAAANAVDFWPVAWGYGRFESQEQPLLSPQRLLDRLECLQMKELVIQEMITLKSGPATACPCCCAVEMLLPSPAYTCCMRCGHRWRMPLGGGGARYYEALVARNDPQTPWFRRKTADRVAALSSLLTPRVQRVLEIGCAEGELGGAIKARFSVVYDGVEVSPDRELARQKLNQVFPTPASQVQSSPYDLIVSFHVLEHIAQPEQELAAWSDLLSDNGYMLIEVPNRSGHPLLGNDHNPEHLHQFTSASLTILLARCGFDCHELSVGHYESPVYSDSIRVVARPQPTADRQKSQLIQRFRDKIGGPFAVYGIGGDFLNYVAPLAQSLEIQALLDSSPTKWGQQFGQQVVAAYDPTEHAELPILVCSIRFATEIKQHLLAMGIAPARIIGLESVYEGP